MKFIDHTDNWLKQTKLMWPLLSKKGKIALRVALGIRQSGTDKNKFHKKAGISKSELNAVLTCKPSKIDLLLQAEDVLGMQLFNVQPL
jgi:hypothetical protein